MEKTNRAKTVNHTLNHSAILWDNNVVTLRLRENMRVKKEMDKNPHNKELQQKLIDYEQWLLKLGEGRLHSKGTIDDSHSNIVEVPVNMCCNTKDAVVKKVFDNFDLLSVWGGHFFLF